MVLSEDVIARRLRAVDQSSESIQTASMWIMHHRDAISMIVNCWSEVFKTADDQSQIALFYVANDVCQKAKKRGDSQVLLQAFATHWINAIAFSRSSENVQKAVNRILDIFEERQIYSKSQCADMRGAQCESNEIDDNALLEFDIGYLMHDVESYHKGNLVMERARELLARSDFNFKDKIKSRMKDRRDGEKFMSEIEQSYTKLTDFLEALDKHRKRGQSLLDAVEKAKRCFNLQLRDATVVEDAYQKFGNGIDDVRSELEEMLKSGVYPGASPPRDAPSPTANDDPFSQGVEEAFVQMRRPRENNEITDMDLEKEDDVITTGSLSSKNKQPMFGSSSVSKVPGGSQMSEDSQINSQHHHSSTGKVDPRLSLAHHQQPQNSAGGSTQASFVSSSPSTSLQQKSSPVDQKIAVTMATTNPPGQYPNPANIPPWMMGPPPSYVPGTQSVITPSLITPLVSSQPHRMSLGGLPTSHAPNLPNSNPPSAHPPSHYYPAEMARLNVFFPPAAPPYPPSIPLPTTSFNIPPPPSTPASYNQSSMPPSPYSPNQNNLNVNTQNITPHGFVASSSTIEISPSAAKNSSQPTSVMKTVGQHRSNFDDRSERASNGKSSERRGSGIPPFDGDRQYSNDNRERRRLSGDENDRSRYERGHIRFEASHTRGKR